LPAILTVAVKEELFTVMEESGQEALDYIMQGAVLVHPTDPL
jgi:hypothetical protein